MSICATLSCDTYKSHAQLQFEFRLIHSAQSTISSRSPISFYRTQGRVQQRKRVSNQSLGRQTAPGQMNLSLKCENLAALNKLKNHFTKILPFISADVFTSIPDFNCHALHCITDRQSGAALLNSALSATKNWWAGA